MQLTKQTDFAFRTLMYLAQRQDDELAHIRDVCDYYKISGNHVSKVVMKLAKLGYIEAVRGKGGGIRLSMAPAQINVADVVAAFETTLKPVNCDRPKCRIRSHCKLKGLLDEGMQAFLDTLRRRSLEDLLR